MVAALLDQIAGDRIGRAVAIFRRPQPHALGLDLLRVISDEKFFHISSSVKSGAGAISTRPASCAGRYRLCQPPRDLARQQQRHPAAHRGTDHDLRPAAELREHRQALLEPAADRAVGELAAGSRRGRNSRTGPQARPCSAAQASRAIALVPCMSDLKPPSQNRPGARCAARHGLRTAIRAPGVALANLDEGGFLVRMRRFGSWIV